ncbi:NAD(P)H-dependent flavin oxidoreductase [Rhizosphaericola mali]|uniref:Propionate 3-nitronate monooxygenase n=1 Tax=Rhizosphaericola mali TaxID=2545455 RepID=A0A5P2G2R7_9BACT|nr:nitronate monooxygenase family protein [Rhizosphaericola mali]QES90104.1 nitronate monooxygenase [Rhizosphaericola mali]
MKWKNHLSELLKINYPIFQAPMFGVATPEMVTATITADCFGTLPLGDLDADKCIEAIRKTKSLTKKTFGVNIFANEIPPITEALKEQFQTTKDYIENFAKENNLDIQLPKLEDIKVHSYHEQTDAIIEENCKVVSFTFGNLDGATIEKLHSHNVILIGTCTSVGEALALENSGIDIICVQGIEAGGHRGSFSNENIPQIGGLSLLAQVTEKVKIPIIYAGGVYNPSTIKAAITCGAQGVQVGSLLIGSKESGLKDFEKERLHSLTEKDITLTKSFSGRYARGIRNKFIETIENTPYILPYPYQNKLTNSLRKLAKDQKNADFVSIWVGQSLHPFSEESTHVILSKLIQDTNAIYPS